MGFLGMTVHWIQVRKGKWKMKAGVIGFKALSGAYSGENLGRYMVGLLDHVGIMDKTGSKASRSVHPAIRSTSFPYHRSKALCSNIR